MIQLGLRYRQLGTEELTWRDLLIVVKNLPRTSALYRSQHGVEEYEWGLPEHLLADVADTLHWLQWKDTKDASRNRNQPKPIPRPGIIDESKQRVGSGSLPVDQMLTWLGGDFILQAS